MIEKLSSKIGDFEKNRTNLVMVLAAVIIVTILYPFSEKTTWSDGLGWNIRFVFDGPLYGELAKDFYSELREGVDNYQIQKILPSAIIYHILRVLGIEGTNNAAITGFIILNGLLVILTAYMWGLIADLLTISYRGKWIGFIALFINFAVLKMAAYYPVLPDIPAMAIGMVMLYFYLSGKNIWLAVITLLGAFTWPTAIYIGVLLLLFPRNLSENGERKRAPFNINVLIALFTSLVLLAGITLFYARGKLQIPHIAINPHIPSISLSTAAVVLYIFTAYLYLFNDEAIFSLKKNIRSTLRITTLLAIGVFAAVKVIQALLAAGEGVSIRDLISALISSSVARPGVFLAAHVLHYGPFIIILLFLWKPTTKIIHRHGLGLTLLSAMGVMLSLFSESRALIIFYPIIIPFSIKFIDKLSWGQAQVRVLLILSLLLSMVWLSLNFHDTPTLLFLSKFGPWMSTRNYGIYGSITLALAYFIFFHFFFGKERDQTNKRLG